MSKDIHLCTVGRKWELPVAACKTDLKIDKIYLLNSTGDDEYAKTEKNVIRKLNGVNIFNIEKVPINPFDYENVYLTVISKCISELEEDPECRFHFNFTAGTNIVAGAMCSAAYLLPNVDFYYLQEGIYNPYSEEDRIIRIQPINADDFNLLDSKKPTAEIFSEFSDKEMIKNSELYTITGKKPSALSYHTDILVKHNLIRREDNNYKNTTWHITEKGMKLLHAFNLKRKIAEITKK